MLTCAELCEDGSKPGRLLYQQVHVAADALRDDVEGLCKTAEFLNNRFSAERLEARLRVYKERLIAVVAAAVEERKAMKARTVRVFPKGLRKKLYTQGQQCALCGSKIHSLAEAHLDHIIPFSKGGPSEEGNAQLVHRFCNSSKGNKSDEEARWAMLASCNDF